MVASIYSEMLQYEEVGGNMVERLEKMNVAYIFVRIIVAYKHDMEVFNKVLFYILHTYSFKSKFHVLGADWLKTKTDVARHVGIMYDDPGVDDNLLLNEVLWLESKAVTGSVQSYLEYQGERNYKHLIMLKDLYEEMVVAALSNIKKASLEVDYDQKFRNHDYATKLLGEIQEWEQRVAEGNRELKAAMEEVQFDAGRVKKSLRLEDNVK